MGEASLTECPGDPCLKVDGSPTQPAELAPVSTGHSGLNMEA